MSDEFRLTRADLRTVDRIAVEVYEIPSAVLMENAGRGAAECMLALWSEVESARNAARALSPSRSVAIFCGPGNNGGDGGVVARHLANEGVHVDVFVTESADTLRGDALLQRRILERMRLPLHDVSSHAAIARAEIALAGAEVLVDALLGTGFHGDVRPKIARVIEWLNSERERRLARVVALDLPSGLDCDSGETAHPTVSADLTVTFAARKIGFDSPTARAVLGEVRVVPIGVPLEILERVRTGGKRL
jgi:NAD(P)H-hydrate epimerase